jgi:hypothetical protein
MVQYEWFVDQPKVLFRALIEIPPRIGIRAILRAPSSSVTGRDLDIPNNTRTTPITRLFRISQMISSKPSTHIELYVSSLHSTRSTIET